MQFRAWNMALVLYVLAMPGVAMAQNSPTDIQFRIPTHIQLVAKDARVGVAGWFIFPDVTARGNALRVRVTAGIVYKHNNRWIEILGGALVPQQGRVDPHANIVFSDRSMRRVGIFSNLELYPRTRRVYSLSWIDTPLRVGALRFRPGVETDCVWYVGKPDARGVGPRVAFPVPFVKQASVAVAHHFKRGRDVLRIYLIFTLP